MKKEKVADTSTSKMTKSQESLEYVLNQHQSIIKEKDSNIESLKERIRTMEAETVCCLKKVTSEDEMFKIKPKNSGKKKKDSDPVIVLKCEFKNCENDNVDIVKCNISEKWVCEECNDVAVAKLKQVANKCKTVFFVCKECEPNSKRSENKENPEIVNTLKTLFDSKVNEVELKLVNLIEDKLGDKIEEIKKATPEKEKEREETYAKVLAVPAEIKKIMRDVKNDEKVEDKEMEKRSKNFIIHGAEEIGDDADEVKKNDTKYIKDILRKIGVRNDPESVERLGKSNEKRQRTMKVVMKSDDDKEEVLSNLRKLKGTEDDFGKISITNDYTKSESDQIRAMADKAKEQSTSNKDRICKVRGDPKNGLRIVSFAKK